MPQPRREQSKDTSAEAAARIVNGPDPDRFYCPHAGCNRSFAELWRLKVHYRAPPDVRGSGKERGHGTELKFCPKCGKELKAGKHHVGCSAGKSAPRQAAKRQRQMSTATESEWATTSSQEQSLDQEDNGSDSWEDTVRRQVDRVNRQRSLDTESSARHARSAAATSVTNQQQQQQPQDNNSCRVGRMQETLFNSDPNAELVFTANTMADFGLILRGAPGGSSQAQPQGHIARHTPPLPHHHGGAAHSGGDPFGSRTLADFAGDDLMADSLAPLRVPSPPPLPPDWDFTSGPSGPSGMLFDFDQFDASRRNTIPGVSEPIMTVTAAMNPAEMSNPSDDYIWQILFAGENDPVPKRVTAHLHHPPEPAPPPRHRGRHHGPSDLATIFDDPDPILDANPWPQGVVAPVEAGDIPGDMAPPPPRGKVAPLAGHSDVPPAPPESMQLASHDGEEPQTVTVTYVVKPGPSGKPQYAVKSVAPGGNGASPPVEDGAAAAAAAPVADTQQGNGRALS